ncbi:TetR/AcrR family transcriptional regulator [Burkholderia sp. MS455]|uniref:AcrR family transcriptional regulator n=1 Tax=Burkholderia pyrrocinia TaxID=60550 RepID=A0A318I3U1_BURPY|nr:TetR/AcrR family transcriptional regulator [Burkholderia sp. MS455]PXX24076.1 AcrR family transcriptional regulator [Burkholderia pyrrocinia]SFW86720.1 transcriptional regulator, TetR family [Burkholderia sp. NFACC33-1]SFY46035.1 transcriptional regulator, TetR family [Burkholderia sp. NFPP32]
MPSAKAPSRARGRARVAALLDAAGVEFAEKGYEATTMTAIAARADSSIGSLYQFFPTKEQVAAGLLEHYLASLGDELDQLRTLASSGDLVLLAARLTTAFVTFRVAHPAFVVLVDAYDFALPGALDVRTRLRGAIGTVLEALAPGMPAGELAVRAAIVQHLMKAAVALSRDATIADPAAALRALEGVMLRYLEETVETGA